MGGFGGGGPRGGVDVSLINVNITCYLQLGKYRVSNSY